VSLCKQICFTLCFIVLAQQSAIAATTVSIGSLGGTLTLAPGVSSQPASSGLTLTDNAPTTSMDGATVQLAGSPATGDVLNCPASTPSGIASYSCSWDGGRKLLTISGTGNVADYQAALRAVTLSLDVNIITRTLNVVIGVGKGLPLAATNHFYEAVPGGAFASCGYVPKNPVTDCWGYNGVIANGPETEAQCTGDTTFNDSSWGACNGSPTLAVTRVPNYPDISWTSARDSAATRNYYGIPGYLVTITSAAEQSYVLSKITQSAWIGASDNYQAINLATGQTTYANQSLSEGKWYWVTGPEKGTQIRDGNASHYYIGPAIAGQYQNWSAGEPNDMAFGGTYGQEDFAYTSGGGSGFWNDFPNTQSVNHYLVEYGDAINDPASLFASRTIDVVVPINGVCVTGQTLTAAPVDPNLCTTGTSSGLVSGTTSYTWSCLGSNGGSDDTTCSATRNYIVTTSVSGGNGTVSANQTVAYNATPSFTMTPNSGYVGSVAGTCGGNLAGNSYTTNAVTANCTVVASFPTYTGNTPTGTGTATATLSGNGGANCGFTGAGFVQPSATPPPGVTFPHGLFNFTLGNCAQGNSVTMTVTYPSPVPAGAQYWKYGPTSIDNSNHWYTIPATINGNSMAFSITDGGLGDDDYTANGTITDAGGQGIVQAQAVPMAIPTLSEWGVMLLAGMLGLFGVGVMRRRSTVEQ
jgi:hypothetical protein